MAVFENADAILAAQDEQGYVTGEVEVDLDTLMSSDFESCMNLLSERLTGTELLADISYRAVGVSEDGAVIVAVTGDPQTVLDVLYDE